MNKKTLTALENVFTAEIEQRLPFQSKAKIYWTLVDEGFLHAVEGKLGGRFPVTIKGFVLSEVGRYEYCLSCKDYEESPEPD